MDLEFWAATDVGRVRDHNEDNFLVDKRLHLFVVCDGMGGHAAGEVASAMSVKVVREVFSNARDVFERLDEDPDNLENRKAVLGLCERAIQEACQRIYQAAQEEVGKRGMGTTCSLLVLHDGRGFIGHVGDSRVYLSRNGQIHQITEDHSLLNEMLRLGKIKPGEEHLLPHKNAVTRAVGVNEFVEVDTFELDVFSGDQFLLCSDGLCGYFKHDDHILALLDTVDIRKATENCITFANEAGGKDNITSIVIRVSGEVGKRRLVQQSMDILRGSPFFQYLSYKELVQVVNLTERLEVDPGRHVCDGTRNDGLFFVMTGLVTTDRDGVGVGEYGPNMYFGELNVVDEGAQPLRATTIEKSQILVIRRNRFMELLRQDPDLAVKLLWNFLQFFSTRLRTLPDAPSNIGLDESSEPTPPSGVLVFEEDLKETGTFDFEPTLDLSPMAESRAPMPEPAVTFGGVEYDPDATLAPRMVLATMPDTAPVSSPAMDWDELDVLIANEDEEDLRKTIQLGELQAPKDDARPRFTGVSGVSEVKDNLPKAQVFKRTKLAVTDEVDTSLADRLKEKRANLAKKTDRT